MSTILIIEDDARIASNISKGLSSEGWNTEIAKDGIEGLEMALTNEYGLILLDINLPGMKGTSVCSQIRRVKPKQPIIMLTAFGEIEDKIEGLGVGADDYIVKPFDFRELIARVKAALRRNEAPASHDVLQIDNLLLNSVTKEVIRGSSPIELTPKEFALLEYMMKNKGRILSKLELAENVWHLNFDPGTNVVEVYINYLRRKIDKDFSPKLIHTRSGLGYTLNNL